MRFSIGSLLVIIILLFCISGCANLDWSTVTQDNDIVFQQVRGGRFYVQLAIWSFITLGLLSDTFRGRDANALGCGCLIFVVALFVLFLANAFVLQDRYTINSQGIWYSGARNSNGYPTLSSGYGVRRTEINIKWEDVVNCKFISEGSAADYRAVGGGVSYDFELRSTETHLVIIDKNNTEMSIYLERLEYDSSLIMLPVNYILDLLFARELLIDREHIAPLLRAIQDYIPKSAESDCKIANARKLYAWHLDR